MKSIEELSSDLDDSRILLTIEEDEWNAVCHPDIEDCDGSNDAPFPFRTSGDSPSTSEVADQFCQQFESNVSKVFHMMSEEDGEFEETLDIEPR